MKYFHIMYKIVYINYCNILIYNIVFYFHIKILKNMYTLT